MEMKGESSSSCAGKVDDDQKDKAEFQQLHRTLERERGSDGTVMFKYRGFWCQDVLLQEVSSALKHFKAKESDIILACMPKSGTTWLKALTFSISTRNIFPIDQSPLLTSNPHKLIPFLEFGACYDHYQPNSDPRILSTHFPFESLPQSILDSDCPILYICRNPLDMFISLHFFLFANEFYEDAPSELDEAFDFFCRGICLYGPFWNHVLGYWNAHRKNPRKVLFLRYGDLQENINLNVKKIAEFIGLPFSPEEEKQGVVEQISSLCSFENLSSLNVNKTGIWNINSTGATMKNSSFFRKGNVGDFVNFLTPAMVERMKKIVEIEFKDSIIPG